jgi:DNA helicase II / ATP-dependent DNA helicase PcrA
MKWNRGLTGKALAIAKADCKYLRVMAGPGTGKTFAMKRRVARLLEEGADPERLLVVTFTRVASASLVRELRDLGVDGCAEITACTLHSFCFGTLNRKEVFDFLGRVARPLVTFLKGGVLQFEGTPLLQDIRMGGKREDTKCIRAFEAAWARLQSDEPGWPLAAADRVFHNQLLQWLTFHRAMLIGELVPEVLRYLRNNPTSPERSQFDHVIADEYQDLNRSDQALLDLLTADRCVIIGDENQSIYRFRYAHPEGISEFGVSHDPTHDEDLDECRRCPKRVVAIANSLIMNNHPSATTPRLRPRSENLEGEVHIIQWRSMDQEATGVANFVKWLLNNRPYVPGDILVLSPRRQLAYRLRDALRDSYVTAHSFYHEEALEDEAAQEAYAYLTLVADPEDRVSLRFLLGLGSNTWLAGQYAKLRSYCHRTGFSPKDSLDQLLSDRSLVPGTNRLVAQYQQIVSRLQQMAGLDGEKLINSLFPEGLETTKLLRDACLPSADEEMKPSDVLDRLRNVITQPEIPEDENIVRIMSLQKSKGLTSKVVLVLGCIEGLVPFEDRDETPEEQEALLREQRRLFYVAMTRPTDILVLSSFANIETHLAFKIGAKTRSVRRQQASTVASRFLSELGPTAPAPRSGSAWERGEYQ